jgi:hypothetical protein
MPDPWHRPDTLAKYELLKKTMNEKGMDVAVRFLLKKQIILDPHAELTDEIERTLLFYQVKAPSSNIGRALQSAPKLGASSSARAGPQRSRVGPTALP